VDRRLGGSRGILHQLRQPQPDEGDEQQSCARLRLPVCADQFEVKAQKKAFGTKVADGAYFTKIERLKSATNPNLMLVNYDATQRQVKTVCVVPRHFFVPDIIQQRPPLAETARRAGWIGSNILLSQVPEAGRIFILRNGVEVPKDDVLQQWKQTLFLRRSGLDARGWLLEVMKAVDLIGRPEFVEHIGGVFTVMRSPDSAEHKPRYVPVAHFTSSEQAMRFVADGELT
jgi:hypothetical protein